MWATYDQAGCVSLALSLDQGPVNNPAPPGPTPNPGPPPAPTPTPENPAPMLTHTCNYSGAKFDDASYEKAKDRMCAADLVWRALGEQPDGHVDNQNRHGMYYDDFTVDSSEYEAYIIPLPGTGDPGTQHLPQCMPGNKFTRTQPRVLPVDRCRYGFDKLRSVCEFGGFMVWPTDGTCYSMNMRVLPKS